MKIRKLFVLIGALFLSTGFINTNQNSTNEASLVATKKTLVTVTGEDSLEVGEVAKYSADVSNVRFMVDDTSIATITPRGYLKAKKAGVVTITAYTKGSTKYASGTKRVTIVGDMYDAPTVTDFLSSQLEVLDATQSSTYNKYKGTQVMNDIDVEVSDVMPNTYGGDTVKYPVIQMKAKTGKMTFVCTHEVVEQTKLQANLALTNGVLASGVEVEVLTSYGGSSLQIPTVTFGGETYQATKTKDELEASKKVVDKSGNYDMSIYTVRYEFGEPTMGVVTIENTNKNAMYLTRATILNEKQEQQETIQGYEHALVLHKAVAPTCSTYGNSEYYECIECGKYFSDFECSEEIQKDSWIIEKTSHNVSANWNSDEIYHWKYCTTCGLKLNEGTHNWDSGELIDQETIKFTCLDCGRVKTQSVDECNHNYVYHDKVNETCTTKGTISHYECSICHKKFAKVGDNYVEKTDEELSINTHDHTIDYNDERVENPTTTSEGVVKYLCTECEEYIPLKKVAKLPTLSQNGNVVSWDAVEGTSTSSLTYKVFVEGKLVGTLNSSQRTYEVTDLATNKYTVEVRAVYDDVNYVEKEGAFLYNSIDAIESRDDMPFTLPGDSEDIMFKESSSVSDVCSTMKPMWTPDGVTMMVTKGDNIISLVVNGVSVESTKKVTIAGSNLAIGSTVEYEIEYTTIEGTFNTTRQVKCIANEKNDYSSANVSGTFKRNTFTAKKRVNDITIDGKKDSEYSNTTPINVNNITWNNASMNTTGVAYLMWDNTYIYGLVEVDDKSGVCTNPDADDGYQYWKDSVEFWISTCETLPTFSTAWGNPNRPTSSYCGEGMYRMHAGGTTLRGGTHWMYDWSDGVPRECAAYKVDNNHYNIEFKIHFAAFAGVSNKEGRIIDVGININDCTSGGEWWSLKGIASSNNGLVNGNHSNVSDSPAYLDHLVLAA